MTLTLPTERTKPEIDPLGQPILVYGRKKSGKTTLAAGLDPDHTLFLATEPGHSAVSIMRLEITTWEEFLGVLVELSANKVKYPYRLVVIDTIDELSRLCRDYVMKGMAEGKFAKDAFVHPSDFDFGKGWDAVAEEFRLRIAQLCRVVGVLFISHEKEGTVKTRTGKEITTFAPDCGQKGLRNWLLGYVNVIGYASIIETTEGKQHVLRLKPTEGIEAGGRIPESVRDEIPELIPLRAEDFKAVLAKVAGA